jgi:hypothetical protein
MPDRRRFFVLTIRRKKPEAGARSGLSRDQVTPQVTGQVDKQPESRIESQVTPPVNLPVTPPATVVVLIRLISSIGPLGNSEIPANLGLRDRTHLRERYIDPALADGLVVRTIPEKPTSRFQKYRLTEKGRRVLEQLGKERGPE